MLICSFSWNSLSPGPQKLQEWIAAQSGSDSTASSNAIAALSTYSMFPAYPTSFVVATDVTIDVSVPLGFA